LGLPAAYPRTLAGFVFVLICTALLQLYRRHM